MSNEFLYGIIAWSILGLFVIPVAVGLFLQGGVFLSAMFGSFLEFGSDEDNGKVTLKLQPHDMDEDY